MEAPAPLGTLRSWVRDGLLAGALVPPIVIVVMLLAFRSLAGGGPKIVEFATLMAVTGLLGALLALVTAPGAWWLASRAWKVPLLAFSLGPVVGAVGLWMLIELTSLLADGRWVPYGWATLLLLWSFGAFLAGPPWVGYLAVRARGRSGLPVVGGALAWVVFAAAALALLDWVRRGWTW